MIRKKMFVCVFFFVGSFIIIDHPVTDMYDLVVGHFNIM